MMWQNPWALLGVLALGLPVFIHLLSRKRAVLQKFPTLRFLNATRLLPTRSPHLTDIPLLIVRLAVLLIATLALTQPLWLSSTRKQTLGASVARVLIVDSSASMMQQNANGRTPHDSALTVAQAMSAESQGSLIVETARPAEALGGASAWLNAQGVRGEVVVLSDFQFGVVDSAAVGRVANSFGVVLVRIPGAPGANSDVGISTTVGRVVAVGDSNGTRAEWNSVTATVSDSSIALFAPASARPSVAAAQRAAFEISPRTLPDSTKHVAVLFDGAPEMAPIVAGAKAPDKEWMSNALMTVRRNNVLSEASMGVTVKDTTIAAPFVVLARTGGGSPVVYAAQAAISGTERLVFVLRGSVSDLTAPALLVAVGEAIARAPGIAEQETQIVADEQLRKFERAPGAIDAPAVSGERTAANRAGLSDARWFWLAVLVLLGLETWMRRKADLAVPQEAA